MELLPHFGELIQKKGNDKTKFVNTKLSGGLRTFYSFFLKASVSPQDVFASCQYMRKSDHRLAAITGKFIFTLPRRLVKKETYLTH